MSAERYNFRPWVSTLICIAAIVALYFVFQDIHSLVAPAKINACGTAGHCNSVKRPKSDTLLTVPPTLPTTPTTAQNVPPRYLPPPYNS